MIEGGNIQDEIAEPTHGISHGGIGTILQLVKAIGLDQAINQHVHLFKFHLPYHESDHVLNIAFNPLCNGTCLDDIELRRQDAAFLDALGTESLPDPTTAGDFCRRFTAEKVLHLQDAIDPSRRVVWGRQPAAFFDEALVDVDGALVLTEGQCKQGIEYTYKGGGGYHPLLISLANTQEVLRLVNRPGNRPSHDVASVFLNETIDLLRQAGFRKIVLRGDTDFSQTTKLDHWSAQRDVEFIFGIDAHPTLVGLAIDLPETAWRPLQRRDKRVPPGPPRRKPANVKPPLVDAHGFETIRTTSEQVASFSYRPVACQRSYRIVVVRKNLSHERGEQRLFDEIIYFFYLTNNATAGDEQIVFRANDRCHQENLIEQLRNGPRALAAPVNTLEANWAYLVMVALGWNLKAWWALGLPVAPGRWQERHAAEKATVLRMEFKRFVPAFIALPCQIVRTGRRLVYRLLGWNPWQPVFYRLARVLRE